MGDSQMLTKTTKNRFSYKLDKLFWWIVSLLPVLSYILYVGFGSVRTSTGSLYTLPDFFASFILNGVGFSDNIVWITLYKLFGMSGVFPIFTSDASLFIFYWFIWVELFHVFFDVIVFIPRLAHKWISKAVQDD